MDYNDNAPGSYSRAIKDLACEERPREKAANFGFRSLTVPELLAILIGSGTPGESVIDLCQRILKANDNKLYNLGRRTINDLTSSYKGIGEAKAITILAALELARRYKDEKFEEQPQLTSCAKVYEYLKWDLCQLDHEEFWLITLNRAKRATGKFVISRGGTSSTVVDVKMLLKTAIQQLADTIIVAHNHPSDNSRPSGPDDDITAKIKTGCQAIDIPLIDHVVVTRNGYYSYAESGKI